MIMEIHGTKYSVCHSFVIEWQVEMYVRSPNRDGSEGDDYIFEIFTEDGGRIIYQTVQTPNDGEKLILEYIRQYAEGCL